MDKMSKDEFVRRATADLKERKHQHKYDIIGYQCEARRRMKKRYRGTNLRTSKGIQISCGGAIL